MEYIRLIWLFSICTTDVQGTTHWMVTETGLIKPRDNSPFEMARPYDLLAFLNQGTRWDNILKLHKDLLRRKAEINVQWTQLEKEADDNALLRFDKNCSNDQPLDSLDWYASYLEEGLSKEIPPDEYQITDPSYGENIDVPDCKKISSLTFSMFAFEHLQSMKTRENLAATAELGLPEIISPMMNVEQFGHWVAHVLRRNSSSWLHYNLASMYWRVRGKVPKALECSRRAVHYAPREYKDVAMLSLGTILLRSRQHEDAVIVLKAAVQHDSECGQCHFILANAYAVVGKFNASIRHYEKSLKINPTFQPAKLNKNGVMCHRILIKKMKSVHQTLAELRKSLAHYAGVEAVWLKTQGAFVRSMKNGDEVDPRDFETIIRRMTEVSGVKMIDVKKDGDRNSLMQYFFDGPLFKDEWLKEKGVHALEAAYHLQRLVKHIAVHSPRASEFVIQPDPNKAPDGNIRKLVVPMLPSIKDSKVKLLTAKPAEDTTKKKVEKITPPKIDEEMLEFDEWEPLYPNTMRVSRNTENFDKDPLWPSDMLCKAIGPMFPESVEVIYPVFLPFENKGISLYGLLTQKIGVSARVEISLPWHPPSCPGKDLLQKKVQRQHSLFEIISTNYLRERLMNYVGDGYPETVTHMQDAEIGERIHMAMEMNIAPKWLLYTLASLYWRVRGNNPYALHCLIAASKITRNKYKDLVMTSLASVYMEMGFYDEAFLAAEESFKIALYEPATNFVLAELNMVKKHTHAHMLHLKQVIRVDPEFMDGLARSLLNNWACLLKQINTLQGREFGDGDVCTQMEPGKNMVCDKDGNNCLSNHMRCFGQAERELVKLDVAESTSTLVHLIGFKEELIQPEKLNDSIFDGFIANMPLEKSDKEGHIDNYNRMMNVIDQLRGCGPRGCGTIQPEDLALKEEDCTFQYLQLGYWLHIISFRQLLSNAEIRLPPEINTMTPTSKKVPECRMFADPNADFFLERLNSVSGEGWEPILSLMHQFAELFNFLDYMTLGAKIAKYVDTKPRSWTGALGAGWWCGAGGRGACAVRCLTAAYSLAPAHLRVHALRSLVALLHMQSKVKDAKKVAYLSFYLSPKSNTEAFLVAVSHSYQKEYEQAVWLYRYALIFDSKYLPAKACLHATMCIMLFGDRTKQ